MDTTSDTKPEWLRIKVPGCVTTNAAMSAIVGRKLCTVCVEAHCPNQMRCFNSGTATFLLLGPNCTRRCRFCAVEKKPVVPPDPGEPERIAATIAELGLNYCVLTMVTRDDLPDGGADHVRRTIAAIRKRSPQIKIEVLISDLAGDKEALNVVLEAGPVVLNHNVETVPRLYPDVRPQADYRRSLKVLSHAAGHPKPMAAKSGIMLGLGESESEVLAVMSDLRRAGCRLLTLGQYLAPSKDHHPVIRYVHPDDFAVYKRKALAMGFAGVASGPLVRSSYKAGELFQTISH